MNRPFPRLVLKIERGSLSHRETTWLHFHTPTAMWTTAHDLIKTVPDNDLTVREIVRITSICVWRDGTANKLTIYTPHEAPWQCPRGFLSSRSQRVSATAILPKEVLDEAAR